MSKTVREIMAAAPMPSTKKLASGIIARTAAYNIDPTRVVIKDGWNNRFDLGDIESLADSIKTELERDPSTGGLINAIHVRRIKHDNADFEVVMGHRRVTAIQLLLSRKTVFPQGVPAVIVDKAESDVELTSKLIIENMQKPLLPLEEAAGYKRLLDLGMTIAQIAKKVGRSDVHVRETLDLLGAADEVQEAVKNGEIAGSVAKLITSVAKGDKAKQADLAAEAKQAKGKTAAAKAAKARLQQKIDKARADKAAAKGKQVEAKVRPLSADQLSTLGEKVAKHLNSVLAESELKQFKEDSEALRKIISEDEKMAAAFTFGALQALLAAAGQKISLEI